MGSVWEDLTTTWGLWATAGETMPEPLWRRRTRLPRWTVVDLYAHAAAWPELLARLADAAVPGTPRWGDAVELLAAFNQPGGLAETAAPQVAAQARDAASRRSRDDLVRSFAEVGPAAVARAAASGDEVADYLGTGTIRLSDAADVGLVEGVVHLLDLRAVTAPDDTLPGAILRRVVTVVGQLADPVALIEAATGRATDPGFPVLR